MTNSIASSKCPSSVLSSGNYGMSQNGCTDESKEYIFVKLTDSAYRAVEEYQRNENVRRSSGQCANIQFIGNAGVIHFPAAPDSSGNICGDGRKFGFAIDDVEGSLECIQQTQHDLDVLGSLSYRMRIHANDDVYDTTRTKMAIAEETEKSKCIREIKPNQTDIGRKVKKLGSSTTSSFQQQQQQQHGSNNNGNTNHHNNNNSSSSYLSSSSNRSKLVTLSNSPPLNGSSYVGSNSGNVVGGSTKMGNNSVISSSSSSRSPNPSMLCGSGTAAGSNSNNLNNHRYGSHTSSSSANLYTHNNASSSSSLLPTLTSASSLSSTLAGGITNGYASVSSGGSPPAISSAPVSQASAAARSKLGLGTGGSAVPRPGASRAGPLGGGSKSSGAGSSGGGGKLPDISRRKIRERLIHLLALKPFKKPELYSRLQNEGLRDKERAQIINTLKDIATMSRDNTYNLRRQMWNDVNENWPYYTEQELQQLKRRKPQNLTPPLSSDAGSSTSGQSPTSTHTGSPPPLVGNGGGLKRGNLEAGGGDDMTFVSGMQAKKQRISHFKKDALGVAMSMSSSEGRVVTTNTTSSGNTRGGYNSNVVSSGGAGYVSQGRNTSYSPHGGGGGNGVGSQHQQHQQQQQQQHQHSGSITQPATDENSGNSDLSYNVLDNVDDLMSRVEQNSYYGVGNNGSGSSGPVTGHSGRSKSSSSNGNNSTKAAGGLKEKRSSSGSGGPTTEHRSSKELMKKGSSLASPKPYGVSFVPESKSNSSSSSSNRNVGGGNYQRHSPSGTQQQHNFKTSNNSVMYSPKTHSQASPREELSTSHSRFQQQQQQQTTSRSSSSKTSMLESRTITPPMQTPLLPPNHSLQQQQQNPHHYQQHQTPPHHDQQPPKHASPTQQIADAASSFTTAATSSSETPRYDFSNYTPITTIEQRRHYKTEFESDYDEYRKLLEQIEGVGRRFRGLAERLENARQGCPDYYIIKQQIVSEYERIRNEETLKRDKQRFDYLHEKLAHIKQLVMDYDKTLTAAAQAAAVQQQQQLLHQQQQQLNPLQRTNVTFESLNAATADVNILALPRTNARLSPMVSGGESNHSPPLPLHTQQQHQYTHYDHQQHHDAETIQQLSPPKKQRHSDITSSLMSSSQLLPTQESSHPPSNSVISAAQQLQEHHSYNGRHEPTQATTLVNQSSANQHNNDSDSDDSSDSNSNDDEDDDDSNSNSNDDDNDHY